MVRLSEKTAEWHYEKLIALHYFEYITPAQKVGIFYHDLEHDILKKITGKKEYFDQLNWLKDNQIRVERNVKKGDIPKVIVDDISNLKNWRNEGVHENNMPELIYKKHLFAMAHTINFFSNIQIPNDLNIVFDNKQYQNIINNNLISRSAKNKKESKGLPRTEAYRIFKEILSPDINSSNTIYSNINEPTKVWWFELKNERFNIDFNLILIDQYEKTLFHFYIKGKSINEPENIFCQRNDDKKKKTSSIQIISTDTKNFIDIKSNDPKFHFGNYLINTKSYGKI